MGLDMYLNARISVNKNEAKKISDIKNVSVDWYNCHMILEVVHWQKAEAIHEWIVQNIGLYEFDSYNNIVSRETMETLLKVCKTVLEDKNKSEELLPSMTYNEYYYVTVKETVTSLEKILADPALENAEFTYEANW